MTSADRTGLTSAAAADRLATHGRNEVPEPKARGPVRRAGDQLRDPMIVLLLVAASVTVALRDAVDTIVIGLVVVLNTAVGVAQELRAERTIRAVRGLAAPTARVVRDNRHMILPAAEVVPGDVIHLEAGDIVPADATLVEAASLSVDESALTGESLPVDKGVAGPAPAAGPNATAGGEVFAGTIVTRGRAVAVVTSTGPHSALGRIATLIAGQPRRPTPLQRRLTELSRILAVAALALSLVVLGIGVLRGESITTMFVTAVALAVAAVPESLPAVVTLSLALGAYRMAQRHAIVRRLPAVETLGSVTVLASDKTGTLTEGRMVVERLWTSAGRWYAVTGTGYSPSGTIDLLDDAAEPESAGGPSDRSSLRALLRDIVLCNDADVQPPGNGAEDWSPVGDPMEASLVAAAMKAGADPAALRVRWPRVAEVPFDSVRRAMTTLHEHAGAWLVVSKGAPEVLLAHASAAGGSDATRRIAAARDAARRLANEGYRVLAVADQVVDARPADGEIGLGLRVVGLVGITDPVRPAARRAVAEVAAAGVRLVLVTGDHPATAQTIAARLGLTGVSGAPGGPSQPADTSVITGDQLERGGPDMRLDDAAVFARIRPEQKVDIVERLQDAGQVVAMTGDGVNDGPALRRAEIGVAMGRGGTEVARQAADLVLQDDNLETVVAAIEEGRRIYDNIRRFLRYALSGGLAEVAVMLIGPFVGLGIPLRPAQILWVNMITHGLPGVALGAEPADPDLLRRPPRSAGESVLGGALSRQVAWTGALLTAAVLGAGWWATATGRPAQTVMFVTLGLAQLAVAIALRSGRGHGPGGSAFLWTAVSGALALQLGAIYLRPLQELVGTVALTAPDLLVVLGIAVLPAVVVRLARAASR